jgi:hypothetical protein
MGGKTIDERNIMKEFVVIINNEYIVSKEVVKEHLVKQLRIPKQNITVKEPPEIPEITETKVVLELPTDVKCCLSEDTIDNIRINLSAFPTFKQWIKTTITFHFDKLKIGDIIEIKEKDGHCYYEKVNSIDFIKKEVTTNLGKYGYNSYQPNVKHIRITKRKEDL